MLALGPDSPTLFAMTAPNEPFSLGECLEYGWNTFKQSAGAYALVSFVLLLAYLVAQLVASRLRGAGVAIGLLLAPIYWICTMSAARAGARGGAPTLNDAFRPFTERQGDYLMVALALTAGVILCGIGIFVSWFLFFFAPLLALDGRDFKRAVLESKDLVLKYPGDVAMLMIVSAAINFAGSLACGLGLIVSAPVTSLMVLKGFEQLSARAAIAPAYPAQPQPPEV
jgi:hypothetical protein